MQNINIKTTDFRQTNKFLLFIALTSIAFYTIFELSIYRIETYRLDLMFILVFLIGIFFRTWQIKGDKAVKLLLLATLLPIIFFSINYISDPETAFEYFLFEKLIKVLGFTAVGFWLGGKLKNIYYFLISAYLGLILALFNTDVIVAFSKIFAGDRVDFSIRNAQHTSMLFGLAVIGFICFSSDMLSTMNRKNRKNKIFLYIIYGFCTVLAIIVFLGTQTRAALIGIDIVYTISTIYLIWLFKKGKFKKKYAIIFFSYAIFSFLILSTSTLSTVNKRSDLDKQVLSQVAEQDYKNIKMSSLGIRINTWIEAGKWIKEKPLHGWGGKVNRHVIQQSDFPPNIKKNFGHFHNTYIEYLLAFGMIGLIFIIFIYLWIIRETYLLYKTNKKYSGIWFFTLYGSMFFAFVNFFESYNFYNTGIYATAVLLAPGYSLYLSKIHTDHNELAMGKIAQTGRG